MLSSTKYLFQLFLASVNVVSVAAADATLNVEVCKKEDNQFQNTDNTHQHTKNNSLSFCQSTTLTLAENSVKLAAKRWHIYMLFP